jgi:LysM repeat protein
MTYDEARAVSVSGASRGSTGPPRPVRRTSAARARLTRRGRVVVVLTTLVLLVVGFSAGRVSSQAASAGHAKPHTITVAPGETLWQLAARIEPHADPRLVVAQIERANHLTGPELLAGEQLITP